MTCQACGYRFHFDPKDLRKNPIRLTDRRFQTFIKGATANGTRFVTKDELYTLACQRRLGQTQTATGCLIVLAAACIVAAAAMSSGLALLVGILFAVLAIAAVARPATLSRDQWDEALDTWRATGRDIPNLIETPSLDTPPPEWLEPDIYDYGFERLLVCDEDLTVDWLVKNGLHTQLNTLVVSERGYPSYLVPRIEHVLASSADLTIYLLHSARPTGRTMVNRIKKVPWLQTDGRRIVDLGLHASELASLKLPREQTLQPERLSAHGVPFVLFAAAFPVAVNEGIALAVAAQRQHVDDSSFG